MFSELWIWSLYAPKYVDDSKVWLKMKQVYLFLNFLKALFYLERRKIYLCTCIVIPYLNVLTKPLKSSILMNRRILMFTTMGIRIRCWIGIRIQEGKKSIKFSCFEVMGVLFWELESFLVACASFVSKSMASFDQKNIIKISCCKFFKFLVIKILATNWIWIHS